MIRWSAYFAAPSMIERWALMKIEVRRLIKWMGSLDPHKSKRLTPIMTEQIDQFFRPHGALLLQR